MVSRCLPKHRGFAYSTQGVASKAGEGAGRRAVRVGVGEGSSPMGGRSAPKTSEIVPPHVESFEERPRMDRGRGGVARDRVQNNALCGGRGG